MKLVKLSIIALSLGLFVTSCGGGSGETKTPDSTATQTAPPATPPPAATPAPDTTKAAAAPAADTTKKADDKMKK